MQPKQQITFPLSRFIELVLRQDDFIELPIEEAALLNELDKAESFSHVEFPSKLNTLLTPRLYTISAWRITAAKHEIARKKAEEHRVEVDNLKTNASRVADKLKAMTGLDTESCVDLAYKMLHKSAANLGETLGISLVEPYYRGLHTIITHRNYD